MIVTSASLHVTNVIQSTHFFDVVKFFLLGVFPPGDGSKTLSSAFEK